MKIFRDFAKKHKNPLIIGGIVVASIFPIAAADNYFEISKNMEIFSDIYKDLNIHYVDEIDPNRLMRTGIDAMLNSLDPYTSYISQAEMEGFRMQTTGKYGGIGAIIKPKNDYITIVEPYENSPANKAGLLPGDLIIEINGKSAKNKSVEEVSSILKGQPGTSLDLLVTRPGVFENKGFTIIRQEITMENVSYYGMINDKIGYIKLEQFTERAGRNVENALKDLQKNNNMQGVVLDLRNNPGGLLMEAVNVANVFIPKNKIVVSTKGKTENREYKTLNQPADTNIPLVVLTNKNSASASEIVAGVIQDYDRGIVIGQRTFGKGLVQQTRNVSYKTKLKLTTAKYFLPTGRGIQAIDYSHRYTDGVVTRIPDSLRNQFKTSNGRFVYDGGGVEPDFKINEENYSNLTISLLVKDHIFDFANQYRIKNPSITSARDFKFTDKDFEEFVKFLSGKSYDYKTKSEDLLEKLVEQTKNEKYYSAVEKEIKDLQNKIKRDKEQDLYKFKEEITMIIEREIISRYYNQKGRIESSFRTDKDIKAAVDIINNKADYNKQLNRSN